MIKKIKEGNIKMRTIPIRGSEQKQNFTKIGCYYFTRIEKCSADEEDWHFQLRLTLISL